MDQSWPVWMDCVRTRGEAIFIRRCSWLLKHMQHMSNPEINSQPAFMGCKRLNHWMNVNTLDNDSQQYLWPTRPWSASMTEKWCSLALQWTTISCFVLWTSIYVVHYTLAFAFGYDYMIRSPNQTWQTQAPLCAQPRIYHGPPYQYGVNIQWVTVSALEICPSFYVFGMCWRGSCQLCQHWNHWNCFQRYISWNNFHIDIVVVI